MAQVKERRLLAAFLAFALAIAGFMAFTVQSAWADDETVDVTVAVIGPNADGEDAYYVDYTKTSVESGTTAMELFENVFESNNLKYELSSDGSYLNAITSPFDGKQYKLEDKGDGVYAYWILFLNAGYADTNAGEYVLKDGDSIIWRYGASKMGESLTLDEFTKSMFRLYNPNSGEHFYTMSKDEKDNLVKLGWNDENIGWTAPLASTVPVYRLYNANGGEHHYTMDKSERDNLVSVGWNDEGIGWYSDANESVKLYREYNPNQFANNHNYTTDKAEHDHLISLGWKSEDTAWYGVAINS